MTGAGRAAGDTPLGRLTVEMRSVNGRQLGVKTRLPAELLVFEPWIQERLRARLERGSVLVVAELESATGAAEAVAETVDAERFRAAADLLRELGRGARIERGPGIGDVLRIPGVVQTSDGGARGERGGRVSRDPDERTAGVVERALDDLIAQRAEEGHATARTMAADLDELEAARASVLARIPEVQAAYRERLLARVNEFLSGRGLALGAEDVVREVAVFAEKSDVSEEVQRLGVHVERLRDRLTDGGVVGRKLDFLLQETLREVNTLGSKLQDAAVAERVVAMKSAVDRLKEQAANLE